MNFITWQLVSTLNSGRHRAMIQKGKNINAWRNLSSFCIRTFISFFTAWPEFGFENSYHVIKLFIKCVLVVIENLGRYYDCFTNGNISYTEKNNNFEILYLQFVLWKNECCILTYKILFWTPEEMRRIREIRMWVENIELDMYWTELARLSAQVAVCY